MAARFIVVTGVSRGLGRAMVSEFIEAGHRIAGCARSADAIRELKDQWGDRHRFDQVDLRDAHAVQMWADAINQQEVPDLLINNGAIINTNAPLWDVPIDEFRDLMEINLGGTFHSVRAFVPAMIARRRGVIVNFSSTWGRTADSEVGPYCASKWGVEGLTKSLSKELPKGLAAVALNPGIIDTDMLRSCFGQHASRFSSPEKWARAAVPFLLSLSAEHNGQSLDAPRI